VTDVVTPPPAEPPAQPPAQPPAPAPARPAAEPGGLAGWLLTRDHKRIGIMILAAGFVMFCFDGVLGLTMRAQLATPSGHILDAQEYNEFFTMHGTGMIAVSITPFALGLGVYLIPIMVGAPRIAAPRLALFGFWLYIAGAITLIWAFLIPDGAAAGWWGYTPLANSVYSPGSGEDLWIVAVILAASGMIIHGGTVLWTILRMRAPGMTMMRLPVFGWTMLISCLMTLASFPALLLAMGVLTVARIDPALVAGNGWNLAYENLFWFYGHPVVYVMFFPFVGCVAEVIAAFSGRRFFNYKGTAFALLVFAALSMAVWGHHMFISEQEVNDYFSLTSMLLSIPAGMEYFGLLGTLIGGRLRYTTAMLFALAFIPQFLIGGLTGIMLGTPTVDYALNNSYFVVAHFHYTLFAGSVFGFFAGVYYWWPKAFGYRLNERVGKIHFILLLIGANMTYLPMFFLGMQGMPRWTATYNASSGFGPLSLLSSIGAGVIGLAIFSFIYNIYLSWRFRKPAPPDPWGGHSLEWLTTSPPPLYNFTAVPRIGSFTPALDLRESAARKARR
jgi:cytochrome c oxidase subunit 1